MPPVQARRPTGWLVRPYFHGRHEIAQSFQAVDEELWLTLRHPAEVLDAARRLLQRHRPGHTATATDDPLLREFGAYLRQAENFYRGANALPWKSSPLNFYYAFLNLAKAYLLISGELPAAAAPGPRRLRHGLSEQIIAAVPDAWQLTTGAATGVLPLLYRKSIGLDIPPGTLVDAHDLLGYALPIGWQLVESGHAARILTFRCRWAMCTTATEAWDLLAIPAHAPRALLGAPFEGAYEEVEHASLKDFALAVWRMPAAESAQYTFFQARVTEPAAPNGGFALTNLQQRLEQALPQAVFEFFTNTEYQLLLCLSCPTISVGPRMPMNQEIASYCVMFFLSSLVRYHPEYIDQIAQSSDAWLIESFVKSAPLELLRSLTAKILGFTFVMEAP